MTFVEWAPAPQPRVASERLIEASQPDFTGFVFKIQANMDPKHRDRIAFMRICSGRYDKGMKMRHVRIDKDVRIADAVTFRAGGSHAGGVGGGGGHYWPAQPRHDSDRRHLHDWGGDCVLPASPTLPPSCSVVSG